MTPPHLQCQYAYKTCTNPRTMKRDGHVHKLCAYHRSRANSVQKTYAIKRRQRTQELRQDKETVVASFEPIPFVVDAPLAVQGDDLVALAVLFDTDILDEMEFLSTVHQNGDDSFHCLL
ncbi:hypothetical protein LEN26_013051 [Aphanomyces euteiches]|nr:hypothetical protein AeMF1_019391 [Aphanomyces euteiches]KAH9114313.1 hypothetical protein LEN26_013051 [Aphanomyces euteiches]KAH9196455.1 hypothetical protein AeNC1_001570 [Aphanomyces euteiches]